MARLLDPNTVETRALEILSRGSVVDIDPGDQYVIVDIDHGAGGELWATLVGMAQDSDLGGIVVTRWACDRLTKAEPGPRSETAMGRYRLLARSLGKGVPFTH